MRPIYCCNFYHVDVDILNDFTINYRQSHVKLAGYQISYHIHYSELGLVGLFGANTSKSVGLSFRVKWILVMLCFEKA